MIFFMNLVMLMVVLGRVDAKKKSNPTILNYITNNYNNNSCTGTCNFGNVTNQIINNNNVTNNQNNITNIFKNETDDHPYYIPLNSTVAFSAWFDGYLTDESGKNTQIPFGKVILNHGDAYDKTTGTFKAPIKGGYSFSYSVKALSGHSNWVTAWIKVEKLNGSKTIYAGTNADNNVVSSNTVNVELDKGDTVRVYLFQNQKLSRIWFKAHTFSGHLLYVA